MKEQEIIEGNELIAKFMGMPHDIDKLGQKVFRFVRSDMRISTWNPFYHLKYDSSWDWLMNVIEKISKLEVEHQRVIPNGKESYFDSYYPRTFAMINAETKEFMVRINHFALHESHSLIEATWLAVIDFIKWYNQNTPQPQDE